MMSKAETGATFFSQKTTPNFEFLISRDGVGWRE